MKRSLSVLLTAVLLIAMLTGMAIPASAEAAGDWQYTVSGDGAVVTGYTGTAAELTVPDTLGGVSVTAVAVSAFENNTTLTAVTLPDTVRLIDECAFMNCAALTSVHVGMVREIAYSAFYGCDALTAVSFGGSETQWKAVSIAAYNDPLSTASVTCLGSTGTVSLLPDNKNGFSTLSEGGGTVTIVPLNEGYAFLSSGGWPSAYTRHTENDYVTVDVFSDTYLNFDFTVYGGYTNIILAFNGMDIINLRTEGQYVTLNRLVDPGYVDEYGTIYDLGDGTYTASVHVGALGCDPALVTNGTFQISDIKIYSVYGATVMVRDLSIGEAKYDVWDLPQTSYTIKEKQTLLPSSHLDFATAYTDTGRIGIAKNDNGFRFSSSGGWPCGYTKRFQTGEGYVLADPDDYIYYDFTVYDYAATHIAVYFGGTSPLTVPTGGYASLNPRIHPSYITSSGDVIDLPYGNYKGFIKVSDLGCSPSLLQDGKVPVSDIKVYAVMGSLLVRELAVVSIETYTEPTTTTSSTTTTTTTTTTFNPKVTFSLSTQKAEVGDTVTVDVTVSDKHYLTNGQLWIDYDPTALALTAPVDEVNSAILDDSTFWAFGTPADGRIKFAFASPNENGSAIGGTLFSLTFTVLDDFISETTLTLTAPEVGVTKDGVDHEPAVTLVNGAVYDADSFLKGDVNLDGTVDLTDATRLFYHVNGLLTLTGKELLAADYTDNGAVDLDDATRLFYYVNGLL